MDRLQKRILDETEKLIASFSWVRFAIFTGVSIAIILLVLWALAFPMELFTVLFAVGISVVYNFFKEFFSSKYSRNVLYTYYNYLLQKRPGIELYVPLFQKNRQGIFLKRASLFFENGELYLEAFNQRKARRGPDDSISVKQGKDFSLGAFYLEQKGRIANYQARLIDADLKISLINIKEVIDLIEQRKEK